MQLDAAIARVHAAIADHDSATLETAVTNVMTPAPARFRANNAPRQLPEFYEAFGVKPGDGMNLPPAGRVALW